MKKKLLFFSFIIIILININNCNNYYPPDKFLSKDIFFDDNDQNNYIVALKYFAINSITPYLYITGLNLDKETSCFSNSTEVETFNGYSDGLPEEESYKEIYENAIYYNKANYFTCLFLESDLKNSQYTIYHKIRIFNFNKEDSESSPKNLTIAFNDKNDTNFKDVFKIEIENNKSKLITLKIKYNENKKFDVNVSSSSSTTSTLKTDIDGIKYIRYSFESSSYSPGVAMYINYENIPSSNSEISDGHLSVIGAGICDRDSNPCVSGYTCIGGTCIKCDDACFDCQRGNSSTHCESKCNVISTTSTPNNGKCEIGYIDITNFQNFNIYNIDYPDTNRLTVSLWFYVSTVNKGKNEISGNEYITLSIPNYFELKIEYESSSDVNIKISKSYFAYSKSITISDKWIYLKFGFSLDHGENNGKKFTYLYSENELEEDSEQNIDYSPNIGTFYKYYYRAGDYETFSFNHLETSNNMKIYLRELLIFKEYLPNPYDIKYFQLEKFITSTSELPELLVAMPFDNLIKNSSGYYTTIYSYKSTKREINIQLTLINNKIIDFEPPRTFKRLNLFTEANVKYTSPDFINKESLKKKNETTDLYLYDDEKPFSCNNNYYLKLNDDNYYTCENECTTDEYSTLFGLSTEKGFCNYKCSDFKSTCLYSYSSLRNIISEFSCQDGYTNMFYKCIETNKLDKYFFYYNSKYTPANIVMDFTNYNYSSYFIDFWFFPDHDEYTEEEKYIFYMNSMKITVKKSTYDVYTIITDINKETIKAPISKYEWNRINLNVYYDPKLPKNKKTKFYYGINNYYRYFNGESENIYPLNYIFFCNGDAANCNGLNLKWASGFYKKLRVYNGNIANIDIIRRYDDIFYRETSRISGMIAYYPLYGKYIAGNYLSQGLTDEAGINTQESNNIWGFPQYNLGINFDFINVKEKYGYFLNENKDEKECQIDNCKRCFKGSACYECESGNFLLADGNCEQNKNYVLKLPSTLNSIPITKNEIGNSNSFTVTFWIKLYGFLSSTSVNDIIKYSNNLKLTLDSTEGSENYGLNLAFYSGSATNYISNYYNFRQDIGIWTFISVAYYDSSEISHFPQMAKFEINYKSMNITGSLPTSISLGPISFNSNNIYALIKSLKIYDTFLVGAYEYDFNKEFLREKNQNLIDPIFHLFELVENKLNCKTLNGQITYDCEPDLENPSISNIYCH